MQPARYPRTCGADLYSRHFQLRQCCLYLRLPRRRQPVELTQYPAQPVIRSVHRSRYSFSTNRLYSLPQYFNLACRHTESPFWCQQQQQQQQYI